MTQLLITKVCSLFAWSVFCARVFSEQTEPTDTAKKLAWRKQAVWLVQFLDSFRNCTCTNVLITINNYYNNDYVWAVLYFLQFFVRSCMLFLYAILSSICSYLFTYMFMHDIDNALMRKLVITSCIVVDHSLSSTLALCPQLLLTAASCPRHRASLTSHINQQTTDSPERTFGQKNPMSHAPPSAWFSHWPWLHYNETGCGLLPHLLHC